MALRILSGLVFNNNDLPNGSVTIGFNPHRLIFGDANITKMRTLGPDRDFTDEPAEHVALRELQVKGAPQMKVFINTITTATEMTITWELRGDIRSPEISYMVIGEV
ncbi:MAG: hypothetical protein GTO02_01820 [Candidatus Dadabacteria bacterium]|nr:hypothetical protein [Candidatus Dadabacteria bacterium]NIQ13175.1 hypothetical protein [Candidatus Dadabacteria bacterium]